jgi:uncharacterized membrane protein YphA (DoxX/SURF4 family)
MDASERAAIWYWILTLLVLLPMAGSGIFELFGHAPQQVQQSFQLLGYPPYLIPMLGLAKVLGALAIVYGRFLGLKEWAYAGYTFNLLGATASHLFAGDSGHAPIPFTLFLILMGSYALWKKKGSRP